MCFILKLLFGQQPANHQEDAEQTVVCAFAACCYRDTGNDGIQESLGESWEAALRREGAEQADQVVAHPYFRAHVNKKT